MNPIRFFVAGEPKPQPRQRSFAVRGKGGKVILDRRGQPIIRTYESGTAENWKFLIANAAKEHVPFPPLQGPIRCDITFWMPRPKAHFRTNGELRPNAPVWHTNRGDRDNLDKAVLDTLTTLGMWDDDGQVCRGEVIKAYGTRPGAEIIIEVLKEGDGEAKPKLPEPCLKDFFGLG